MEENIVAIARLLHIAAGTICLLSGMVAIVTRKGDRNHRLSGKLYFGSMSVVALTAITITMIKPSQLLLSLGVFSFYLALTGYRALAHKRLHRGIGVMTIDWAAAVVTILFSAVLLVSGLTGAEKTAEGQNVINVTSIFFGVLGIVLVSGTIYRIARPKKAAKGSWFVQHIIFMMSSYIAVVTAVSVTVLKFIPPLVAWIAPSIIGIAIISIMIARYQKPKAEPN